MATIVYVRMILLLRYSCTPNITGLLAKTDQDLIAPDEQIRVVERKTGGRPPRGVEMVDRECGAGRPTRRGKRLRPNAAIAVRTGHVVNQPSIGRPLRRGDPRAAIGKGDPCAGWRHPIGKGRDINSGGAAIQPGDKNDPAVVGRETRLPQIRGGILQDGDLVRVSNPDQAYSKTAITKERINQRGPAVLRPSGQRGTAGFA